MNFSIIRNKLNYEKLFSFNINPILTFLIIEGYSIKKLKTLLDNVANKDFSQGFISSLNMK
jgi:hypothetical protein